MSMIENEICEFNKFLESDSFEIVEFEKLYHSIKNNKKLKLKLIDLDYYNHKRMEEAKNEKINCIQLQNFEKAASSRDLELECQKYIDLKTEFQIEKSTFLYIQKHLIYFYLGTAKNDKLLLEYFKKEAMSPIYTKILKKCPRSVNLF